ncbi:glycerate kinase [Microbacterium sediminicola]|uniref:Glycerate kinase n=1 Tax=Microbacterium sediminicola TaxID=415210 RepID=A0ABN2I8H7_9MICO
MPQNPANRRVVVALDSFKGSISAPDAVDALEGGWSARRPDDDLVSLPMADGGEGTLACLARVFPDAARIPVDVVGPDGVPLRASWLRIADGDGTTGVVELASTSGIELLGDARRPWDADSGGFGAAIAAAMDAGVDRLVLGIGSSASTDGGAGVLTALGARVQDAAGRPIPPGLAGLAHVDRVDVGTLRALPPGGATVLCDVTNPLCGPAGAAPVFGPQKGLRGGEITAADRLLGTWAERFGVDPSTPGAGAAGGVGFALLAWGARLVPGAAAVASLTGFDELVDADTVVLTGEGAFDASSARGKVPGHVAARAAARGARTILVAGRISADADVSPFAEAFSLADLAGSSEAALAEPARYLREAGRLAASSL